MTMNSGCIYREVTSGSHEELGVALPGKKLVRVKGAGAESFARFKNRLKCRTHSFAIIFDGYFCSCR